MNKKIPVEQKEIEKFYSGTHWTKEEMAKIRLTERLPRGMGIDAPKGSLLANIIAPPVIGVDNTNGDYILIYDSQEVVTKLTLKMVKETLYDIRNPKPRAYYLCSCGFRPDFPQTYEEPFCPICNNTDLKRLLPSPVG